MLAACYTCYVRVYVMCAAALWRLTAYPQDLTLLILKVLVFQTGFMINKQPRFQGLEKIHPET